MTTKTKTFDCVEMKNEIQADLYAKYQARKDEFTSYADFLKKTESDWSRQMREKFGKKT